MRLQLQKKAPANEGAPKYRGLLGTVATIAREEGLSALWNGIIPGLHRQCIYGGLRIGLYGPVSPEWFLAADLTVKKFQGIDLFSLFRKLFVK